MPDILSITAPVFILIALGYFSVEIKILPRDAMGYLGRFVLYLALPALLFTNIVELDIAQVFNLHFIAIYLAAGMGVFVIGALVAHFSTRGRSEPDGSAVGIKAIGASVGNLPFIGLSLVLQVFEQPPVQAVAMGVAVDNIVLMPLAYLFIAWMSAGAAGDDQQSLRVMLRVLLRRIFTHPVLIAVFAAVLCSGLNIRPWAAVDEALVILAGAAAPLSLIVIGGALAGQKQGMQLRETLPIALLKLLLHPLLAVGLLWVFPGLTPDLTLALILLTAMPVLSVYAVIGAEYGHMTFCARVLLLSTLLSFISLNLLLWIYF